MIKFESITNDILRLKVPFESIYTAVFLIKTDEGAILADAAATKYDAEEIIIPALREVTELDDIKYIFCTHLHGDHGGGIRHLLPHLKNAKVAAASSRAIELYGEENVRILCDGDSLFGISALALKGHSHDSMGLFDSRTQTLILGDAVQLCGIMKYGTGIDLPDEYRRTLLRISDMKVQRLVASHEYYPLGSIAEGDEVDRYINEAQRVYKEIEDFVNANRDIGDAVAIAKAFTKASLERDADMTQLQSYTVRALLK